MKKYNKNIILFFMISIFSFILIAPQKENTHTVTSIKKNEKKSIDPQIKSEPKRSIASIPTSTPAIPNKARVVIGDSLGPYIVTNKVNKDWEKLYRRSFYRTVRAEDVKEMSITQKKSIVMIKGGRGQNLEHVVVSFKRHNGLKYSFEAYVNSQTGMMVNSWNQTRFEINKEPLLDPTGRAYKEF